MSVIVYQFQTVKFIQMMSLTVGLFTQVSGSGPLGPLVVTEVNGVSYVGWIVKEEEFEDTNFVKILQLT